MSDDLDDATDGWKKTRYATATSLASTNATANTGASSNFLSSFGGLGGLSGGAGLNTGLSLRDDVEKRQFLEQIFGTGDDLIKGLFGANSTSSNFLSNFGGLRGNAGLRSSFNLRDDVEKRQFLEQIFGTGDDLIKGLFGANSTSSNFLSSFRGLNGGASANGRFNL